MFNNSISEMPRKVLKNGTVRSRETNKTKNVIIMIVNVNRNIGSRERSGTEED